MKIQELWFYELLRYFIPNGLSLSNKIYVMLNIYKLITKWL